MYFSSFWTATYFLPSLGGIFLHLDFNIGQIKSGYEYTATAVQNIITTIKIIKLFIIHYMWVKKYLSKMNLF